MQNQSSKMQIYLDKFSVIKNNAIYIDYSVFKGIANEITYDIITKHLVDLLNQILREHPTFTIHFSLKSLTISELDKHYNYINHVCPVFKNEFPDKLDVCYVYNAPFIVSKVISIISFFIDKTTQEKIKLMPRSSPFEI
jgi:hypothetical protein